MLPSEARDFRRRLEVAQRTVAELSGVDHSSISRWERGERHLAPETERRVLAALEAAERARDAVEHQREVGRFIQEEILG